MPPLTPPLHQRMLLRSYPAGTCPCYAAVLSADGTCAGFVRSSSFPVQGIGPTQHLANAVARTLDSETKRSPGTRLRLAVEAGQAALATLRERADGNDHDGDWDFGGSLALVLASEHGLHWAAIGQVSLYALHGDRLSIVKAADTYCNDLLAEGATLPPELQGVNNIVTRYLGGGDAQAQAAYGVLPEGRLCSAAEGMDTSVVVNRFCVAPGDGRDPAVGVDCGAVMLAWLGR